MPRLRALIASVAGGLLVFAVIGFWLRWPMYLSVTLAALLGVVFLMMAAALDDEGAAADLAWRAAAADLLGGDGAGTPNAQPSGTDAAVDTAGEPDAALDPSGEAPAVIAAGESEAGTEPGAEPAAVVHALAPAAGAVPAEAVVAESLPAAESLGSTMRVEGEAEP